MLFANIIMVCQVWYSSDLKNCKVQPFSFGCCCLIWILHNFLLFTILRNSLYFAHIRMYYLLQCNGNFGRYRFDLLQNAKGLFHFKSGHQLIINSLRIYGFFSFSARFFVSWDILKITSRLLESDAIARVFCYTLGYWNVGCKSLTIELLSYLRKAPVSIGWWWYLVLPFTYPIYCHTNFRF